ncbi:dTDP-4-dehydrorhamnose reductase [Bradyrhizobium sp. AZCC 1588]
MRVLVIGAAGQLGSDLVRNNPGYELIAASRQELDLTDVEGISARIKATGVDWVINTAAFHNVVKCEEEPGRAFELNCVAVRNLARICQEQNVQLMTFSTDYVFGGDQLRPYSEEDRPAPLQIYGISKLAGEMAARAAAPENVTIVRTCGLFGNAGAASKGGNFVDNRVADGHRGGRLEISSDQIVCPTSTQDLSVAVHALIGNPAAMPGIYHLINEGECSWYEFTAAIFEHLRIDVDLRPVDRGGRSGVVRRPRYSVLANTNAKSLGIQLPNWKDALKRYLKEKFPRPEVAGRD